MVGIEEFEEFFHEGGWDAHMNYARKHLQEKFYPTNEGPPSWDRCAAWLFLTAFKKAQP